MSARALRARRRNLQAAGCGGKVKRLRSDRESRIIKLIIWQWFFDQKPKPSRRALARQLGVRPSYVCEVQKQATSMGWDALVKFGRRVTLDDLADARRFTAKLRDMEPGLLAPAPRPSASDQPRWMTADDAIAERWREVNEWKRKNLWRNDNRRRISVPILR